MNFLSVDTLDIISNDKKLEHFLCSYSTESYIKVILAIFDVLLQVHKIDIITIVETNKGIFLNILPFNVI